MLLIAFTGKKQSGKDSACRFLAHNAGHIWPSRSEVVCGDYRYQRNEWPSTDVFHVGNPMKEFAVGFGVPRELLWGTDEQKNQKIHIRWEQLPYYDSLYNRWVDRGEWPRVGPMTVREFLQQIGEEMFLTIDPQYWVKQFVNSVKRSTAKYGFVADARKPEQVVAIKGLGGITFRLTRDPYKGADKHVSELALDRENFDWSNFDFVIENDELTVADTNRLVLKALISAGHACPTAEDVGAIDWDPRPLAAG